MTTHVRFNQTTVVAGADLTAQSARYCAVGVAGTIAATNAAALGLLRSSTPAGGHAAVAYEGEMKARASAALTAGNRLGVTTSGWIAAVGATSGSIGIALESCNSGDLFRGLFNFVNYGG